MSSEEDPNRYPALLRIQGIRRFFSDYANLSRKKKQEKLSIAIDEYLGTSQNYEVSIEKLFLEASTIEQGIVELVERHRIQKLVLGASADRFLSCTTSMKPKIAAYVRDNAPQFCHISFICGGSLIYAREAINSPYLSPAAPVAAEIYQEVDSSTMCGAPCLSIATNDGLVSRTPIVLEFASSCTSQQSTIIFEHEPESRVIDHPYSQIIKHDPMIDETICQVDFKNLERHRTAENNATSSQVESEGSVRCPTAENNALVDAVSTVQAKMSERLEMTLKLRQAEEKLAEEKEKLKSTEDLLDRTSNELHLLKAKKTSLEETNLSLQESEDKLLLAVNLMVDYRIKCEDMQLKLKNALDEAEFLRKKLAAAGPSIGHPNDFSSFFSKFTLSQLEDATNDFDELLKIGEGGYGNVYKGVLRHTKVAIKRLHRHSSQGPREFMQEVEILSKLRHPNLVTLIGACPESFALVYEYLPGGSLEDRLVCKDNAPPLPWQTRISIATELCSALIFLHTSQLGSVIHGDLKPSNVLLNENCVCKLSDFGICRVTSNGNSSDMVITNQLRGTIMYMDPEFMSTGELTCKADTYSFGIILLRLLTGKSAVSIRRYVESALSEGKLGSVLDTSAGDWPFIQAEQLTRMALRCCDVIRGNRPDLRTDVWRVLEPLKSSCRSFPAVRLPHTEAPKYFICPIFHEIMQNPHVAADGFTYEAEAIRGWFDGGRNTSPMTNLPLLNHHLIPNFALRSAIREWLLHNRIV